MSGRKEIRWVVAGGAIGEAAHCQRCGAGLTLPMPIDLDVFIGAADGFGKSHRHCKEGDYVAPEIARESWLRSRDTGVSALTIWSVMTGQPSPADCYSVPWDVSDFGRCQRLLRLFPEWVPRMPEVAAKYPDWLPLVEGWPDLMALFEEDEPRGRSERLFARLKKGRATEAEALATLRRSRNLRRLEAENDGEERLPS
jgi:hypothetical protein